MSQAGTKLPITKGRLLWAVLLSVFVLPGAGEIFLGYRKRGIFLGILTCVLVGVGVYLYFISLLTRIAAVDHLGEPVDIGLALIRSFQENYNVLVLIFYGLITVWAASILETYHLGRARLAVVSASLQPPQPGV